MKILTVIITIAILFNAVVIAQSQSNRTPQLREVRSSQTDELYVADGEVFYYRSGENISLPLFEGNSLRLGLDSSLSTDGMVGNKMIRYLPLKSDIQSPYGQSYSTKDTVIETSISGYKSGLKNQAALVIDPQTIVVNVGAEDYLQIGIKDGHRVFLKPGRWTLRLRCSPQSIENPEGRSWYAKNGDEPVIRGPKFGSEHKNPNVNADPYSGFLYINQVGTVLYGITQFSGLFAIVFHRPNIRLPATTELFYRINEARACFVADAKPKGPAQIFRKDPF
ncbi:MAG TPA: hypothetical protein VFC63_12985 [Blastocatellia bacterium]|nr:hypothetical protein [Blastocatellia bacterium]